MAKNNKVNTFIIFLGGIFLNIRENILKIRVGFWCIQDTNFFKDDGMYFRLWEHAIIFYLMIASHGLVI